LTSTLAGREWLASRPRRFTPEDWIGGWVDPRAGLDDVKKKKFLTLRELELQSLGRPARSQSLYRLCYPGSYKLPGSDQISAGLIQAGSEILRSEIHKLINSVWNNSELSDQWKESIVVPVHKMVDETDCNNYHGILLLSNDLTTLLSNSYKILSIILLSRLSPYVD
jgi:hypothetical protein